ncbi:carbamoyl-phosphate synthase large subunit [Bifidobacterium mongoliense]|jgi:carbamoyl-phosphate synthase large subunit|uniref:Carbamoyl phosphate synthase large chain n=2 Tax=Bifidobacterium mongoliense TaxID=518643 RepID=A0A087CAE1_9BIFI|nr:carbamoyl-phosphate synthase large subunit [Bifidobacterium mongoliense]KFI80241.1 carbamoyl-phosphate synthase large subunit [Bifidobacterium mongoliense DSM 21395]MDN5979253.1 carbamoyl-phosphate synthase large subunit [Bifidobacterium mongoliense]MDN6783033.1 carbamoyl-phosphate synthase large subunit [Bifidobacterium mongoliense]MDY3125397.1 carbamoyl-phosphate synthase large subunit [Bifidobacterium mongoliense]ROT86917.1 carbamoyl phosphate synthase large subunit [Bifidobacterium mong
MPKRNDISSVLVIGSGPIVIGQAAEFDYSGTQACRVLREEGVRVILVNSNPATIMTDPEMADATYIEPIDTAILERIIAKERPDALLPTLGGQTALNAAIELGKAGVLERYHVELIGASLEAINRGEDREKFKVVVDAAGGESARSEVAHTMEGVDKIVEKLGFPVVIRPSFTMGGLGSGIAHDPEELHRIASAGIHYSPTDEVLVEEGIEGWKEYELELMRDAKDNVVVVCPIENVDPVGVHTGDSITVAPTFTLTDREYQRMRDIGIAIIRGVGVETGGCNIQFAINPKTGRIIVIEMNPRVSRSSALASKATGFPIAKIAAKLALGYTLDEIRNDITQSTPASFEPTIDYVVTKIPRFAFEKFPGADPLLTTSMKSVGEAMALGGNFQESLGKAMRSIDKRHMGFNWDGEKPDTDEVNGLLEQMRTPTEHRYLQVQRALWGGASEEQIFDATKIDPWFIRQFALINETAMLVRNAETLSPRLLLKAKRAGLSDLQIAGLRRLGDEGENVVRELRWSYGLRPVYKTVDTCAAEFDAVTPYYYSCYADESELRHREREAVIILGSGPNRIGQGIEFDYTCVHAVQELGKDYDTIMVNCNPETVSTDYDMSDRLYFEPLTFEDVLEIYEAECRMGPVKGVVVQLGGQTPLSLAARLKAAGVPILGTSPEHIDLAENRELFGEVLRKEHLNAPRYGTAQNMDEAREAAHQIGYPVLVRPSYVLGGRGMEIVYDDSQLETYVNRALNEAKADTVVSGRLPSPLLIDKFLQDAIEIDVDALFDGKELYIGGIMEHVEEAGVHSGDAACTLPPSTLSDDQINRLRKATYALAQGCGVRGLMNVQYAFMANTLYVIEANPRASRTVPFASKATGVALAKAAARLLVGETIADQRRRGLLLPKEDGGVIHPGQQVAVKESVLPFKRFRTPVGKTVDVLLGPEMRSTGEVMGFDRDFPHAFAKSQLAAYSGGLPTSGTVFLSVNDTDKRQLPLMAVRLIELGFTICATEGTASVLRRYGIDSKIVDKISTRVDTDPDTPPSIEHARGSIGKNVVDLIEDGDIDMILNTPNSRGSRSDGYSIRVAAIAADLPQFTTITEFSAVLMAIEAVKNNDYQIMSIQEHARQLFAMDQQDAA